MTGNIFFRNRPITRHFRDIFKKFLKKREKIEIWCGWPWKVARHLSKNPYFWPNISHRFLKIDQFWWNRACLYQNRLFWSSDFCRQISNISLFPDDLVMSFIQRRSVCTAAFCLSHHRCKQRIEKLATRDFLNASGFRSWLRRLFIAYAPNSAIEKNAFFRLRPYF